MTSVNQHVARTKGWDPHSMSTRVQTRWVIVIFLPPSLIDPAVRAFRTEYDPLAKHIAPHVTLVHPFIDDIDSDRLKSHVAEIAAASRPFDVTLGEVTPFPDGYIYLNVKKGNDAIVSLRDQLYEGLLARHKSRWDTFVPHVTIGRADDPPTMRRAVAEANALDLRTTVVFNTISAYCFDDHERRTAQFEVRLRN